LRNRSHVRYVTVLAALALAACCKEGPEEKEATLEAGQETSEAPPAATTEAPTATPSPAAGDPMNPDATAVPADAATVTPTATSTATRPPTATGVNQVKACCTALQSAAGKASRADKPTYSAAAAVCSGMIKSVEKGVISASGAKQTIRAQLQRVTIPSACR
jgi:hypothetical protein